MVVIDCRAFRIDLVLQLPLELIFFPKPIYKPVKLSKQRIKPNSHHFFIDLSLNWAKKVDNLLSFELKP
jgi:hypothetical protein